MSGSVEAAVTRWAWLNPANTPGSGWQSPTPARVEGSRTSLALGGSRQSPRKGHSDFGQVDVMAIELGHVPWIPPL